MAIWDGPDVPSQFDYISPLEEGNYNRSEEYTKIYNDKFVPTEQEYVGGPQLEASGRPIPGTFQPGEMSQDLTGLAQTRASADVAQATFAQRQKLSPLMANSGSFSSTVGNLAKAQGTGVGQAMGQAQAAGTVDVVNRELNALRAGMGLGTGIMRSGSQAASQASQRGTQLMNAQFSQNQAENQQSMAMVTAAAGGLGGQAGGMIGNKFSSAGTQDWKFDPADWTHLD